MLGEDGLSSQNTFMNELRAKDGGAKDGHPDARPVGGPAPLADHFP